VNAIEFNANIFITAKQYRTASLLERIGGRRTVVGGHKTVPQSGVWQWHGVSHGDKR